MTPEPAAVQEARKWFEERARLCEGVEADLQSLGALLATYAAAQRQELESELGAVIGWDRTEKTLLQALKDEWHDFMMVVDHCSRIYDAASGGTISKPNTLPGEVIRAMEDRENEDIAEAVAEETADLRAQLAAAEQRQRGPLAKP